MKNVKDLFQRSTGAPSSGLKAAQKPSLSDAPVMASALVTTLPPVFGRSNIGRLAVNIVANRLLAAGADPRYIGATVTIDFDTPFTTMEAVANGLNEASVQTEMEWTAIETSIKPIGPATGLAISAFGVGSRMVNVTSKPDSPRPGDALIITGPVGTTGAAVEGSLRGIEVDTEGDGTALTDVMRAVYEHDSDLSTVFFPYTGISEALRALGIAADIDLSAIPLTDPVKTACATMGLNPLELITADAMLLAVSPDKADDIVEAVRRTTAGAHAAVIGHVVGS